MKKRVSTIGKPKISALSKTEQKVFYSFLLSEILDFKRSKQNDKSKPS